MKTTGVTTLLLLLSSVICSVPAGQPIGCKTSGVVSEGSPATLTCDFDNTFDKTDFMVYRNRSAIAEEMILALCGWETGKLKCRHFNGFHLKAAESNGQVIFEIKSAQESESGTYVCKTLPASESEATACSLTVQKNGLIGDGVIGCHTSTAHLGEKASVSCSFPQTVGMNGIILEKFNDNNGRKKDEIVRCEKDGGCIVKEGYENEHKTPTDLKISIPYFSTEQAGIYVCSSPSLPGATAICTLSLSTGESNGGTRRWLTKLLNPLYAILGCFMLLCLLMIAAVIFGVRYCRQQSPPLSSTTKGTGKASTNEKEKKDRPDSQSSLL